jgi:phage/plasmid-associated DNA primase
LKAPATLSAALRKAVLGLQRLRSNGRFSTAGTSAEIAKEAYLSMNDSAYGFLKRFWDRAPRDHVYGRQELYDEYLRYCEREHLGTAGRVEFDSRVRDVLGAVEDRPRLSDGTRPHVWRGIVRHADSV